MDEKDFSKIDFDNLHDAYRQIIFRLVPGGWQSVADYAEEARVFLIDANLARHTGVKEIADPIQADVVRLGSALRFGAICFEKNKINFPEATDEAAQNQIILDCIQVGSLVGAFVEAGTSLVASALLDEQRYAAFHKNVDGAAESFRFMGGVDQYGKDVASGFRAAIVDLSMSAIGNAFSNRGLYYPDKDQEFLRTAFANALTPRPPS